MKWLKAPGNEDLAESFMQFANAQPEIAGFVVLFTVAMVARILTR